MSRRTVVGSTADVLVTNTRASAGARHPSQGPELPAQLGDEVGGVLGVGGFDEVVVGVGHIAVLAVLAVRIVVSDHRDQ